jgi:hypothetical protein
MLVAIMTHLRLWQEPASIY